MKRAVNDHEEVWLLLPWLANGRLPEPLRWRAHRHVAVCAPCRDELALQQRLCEAFTAPESISYAPGPSLARLLQRIDEAGAAHAPRDAEIHGAAPVTPEARAAEPRASEPLTVVALAPRARPRWSSPRLAWLTTSPGLAWAATVLIAFGLMGNLAYRAMQPAYRVHSDAPAPAPQALLHIAFARNLTIGEAASLLHAAGAQVVEGPGNTGIFAVSPAGASAADLRTRLQQLASQLRADPRVRWVEPLPASADPPAHP